MRFRGTTCYVWWLAFCRRIGATSNTDFVLGFVSKATTVLQLFIAAIWTLRTANAPKSAGTEMWVFLGSFIVNYAVTFFAPQHSNERTAAEAERRAARLAFAISKVTVLASGGAFDLAGLRDIERAMLDAIKSEAERATWDVHGEYMNASLIVPDSEQDALVRCIVRTDSSRPVPQTYPKTGMLAWKCMSSGQIVSQPQYDEPGKPYKSILCFPLYYKVGEEARALGCVSVDHAHAFAFTGVDSDLKATLQPYLRMLELVLVLRLQKDVWAGGQAQSNKKRSRIK